MGSLFGHALPGTFFYMFGVWYLLNAYYYYFKFKYQNGTKEKNVNKIMRFAFPIKSCCSSKIVPIEGIIKMTVTLIGMCVEGVGFFWGIPAMYQHFTMYASFCISGFIDILMFYEFAVPQNMDYCLHVMSFFLEGLLFAFHLHGRSMLDVALHTLLVYTCYFCAIMIIALLISNNRMIFRIMLAIGALVQGSWFWQAGQVLYPIVGSKWCETCHENVMLAVMIFCWHVVLNSLFSIGLFMIMSKIMSSTKIQPAARYQYLKDDKNKDQDIEDQSTDLLEMPIKSNGDAFL